MVTPASMAVPLKQHLDELEAERELRRVEVAASHLQWLAERDQRYAEVKAAEEKALKVKETADLKALDLASQIQAYKDEKGNELREQISNERGMYVTRDDLGSVTREMAATIKPLTDYVSADRGRTLGIDEQLQNANRAQNFRLAMVGVLVSAVVIVVNLIVYLHK